RHHEHLVRDSLRAALFTLLADEEAHLEALLSLRRGLLLLHRLRLSAPRPPLLHSRQRPGRLEADDQLARRWVGASHPAHHRRSRRVHMGLLLAYQVGPPVRRADT